MMMSTMELKYLVGVPVLGGGCKSGGQQLWRGGGG